MTNLIGPAPQDVPKYPTPWSAALGSVYAANGVEVADLDLTLDTRDSTDVAEAIVKAVNRAHEPSSIESPRLRDFVDRDNENWFEVQPGVVVFAISREGAERIYSECGGSRTWSLDDVARNWGLVEIPQELS